MNPDLSEAIRCITGKPEANASVRLYVDAHEVVRGRQECTAAARERVRRHNRQIVTFETDTGRVWAINDDGRLILVEAAGVGIVLNILDDEDRTLCDLVCPRRRFLRCFAGFKADGFVEADATQVLNHDW